MPALGYEPGGKEVCFFCVLLSLRSKANLFFAAVGRVFFLFYKSGLLQFFYEGCGGGFISVDFLRKFSHRKAFLTAKAEENVSVAGCHLG